MNQQQQQLGHQASQGQESGGSLDWLGLESPVNAPTMPPQSSQQQQFGKMGQSSTPGMTPGLPPSSMASMGMSPSIPANLTPQQQQQLYLMMQQRQQQQQSQNQALMYQQILLQQQLRQQQQAQQGQQQGQSQQGISPPGASSGLAPTQQQQQQQASALSYFSARPPVSSTNAPSTSIQTSQPQSVQNQGGSNASPVVPQSLPTLHPNAFSNLTPQQIQQIQQMQQKQAQMQQMQLSAQQQQQQAQIQGTNNPPDASPGLNMMGAPNLRVNSQQQLQQMQAQLQMQQKLQLQAQLQAQQYQLRQQQQALQNQQIQLQQAQQVQQGLSSGNTTNTPTAYSPPLQPGQPLQQPSQLNATGGNPTNQMSLQQQLQLQQLQQQLIKQQQAQAQQAQQASLHQQKRQRKSISASASPALRTGVPLAPNIVPGTPPLRPGMTLNPQQQLLLAQQQQRLILQRQAQQEWINNYVNFMKQIGKELTRFPMIGNKPLDLQGLMNAVVQSGGYEKVTSDKRWGFLAKQSRLDTIGYTAESLRQFYSTLLFDYEKKCHPNLVRSTSMSSTTIPMPMSVLSETSGNDPMSQQSSVLAYSPVNSTMSVSIPVPGDVQISPTDSLPSNSVSSSSAQLSHIPSPALLMKPNVPPQPMVPPEPRVFIPKVRKISSYGGLEGPIFELANMMTHLEKPDIFSLGKLDVYRMDMSLRSRLDTEVKYALDALLAISYQKQTLLPFSKLPKLLRSVLDIFEICMCEAFGPPPLLSNRHDRKRPGSWFVTYADLFSAEEREILNWESSESHKTLVDDRTAHAERLITITTLLSNFSFQPENAQVFSQDPRLKKLVSRLVWIVAYPEAPIKGFGYRKAGYLLHRKNLAVLFSNVANQWHLSPESGPLYIHLFLDFMKTKEINYGYLALEALAKFSLVDTNYDAFVSYEEPEELVSLTLEYLPLEGLNLDATPETIAGWELASLLLANTTGLSDDGIMKCIVDGPGHLQHILRLAESGIAVGSDQHADYIRIITCRILKSLTDLASSHEALPKLAKYESRLVQLLFSIKMSTSITRAFQEQAVEFVTDCLSALSEAQFEDNRL